MQLILRVEKSNRYSIHHTVIRNKLGVELLCHDCMTNDQLPVVVFSITAASLERFMEAAQNHESSVHAASKEN